MCIWCKLPPWICERFVLFPLESSQISHAYVRSILWFGRLITSTPYVFPSTPSHWLICSRRRSSFIRANHMTYARTSLSTAMVPNQNSVVFYYKTTMWSCFSRTTCPHVVAEPAHVLGLAIKVHSPGFSQCHVVGLCCKLSFPHMPSEISCSQPDLNLRQIWWLEHSQEL